MLPFDDWGGFEKLVAAMNQTGSVSVEHDALVRDRNGIERQVDVLITHATELYEHRIVAECKYWNKRVPRTVVDALATTVRELNASKGAIFSNVGFQRGAVETARALGIELFKVRQLTHDEWLIPGQVVPIYYQAFSRGIGNIAVKEISAVGGARVPDQLSFPFTAAPSEFLLPQANPPLGFQKASVMELVEMFTLKMLVSDIAARGIIFDCKEGETVFLRAAASLTPKSPIVVPVPDGQLHVSRVDVEMGIEVKQGRIDYDQAAHYRFVLALEDCINRKTQLAFRKTKATITSYQESNREPLPDNHLLRNGIVLHSFQERLFDFETESSRFGPEPISHPQKCQVFLASNLPGMR